MARTAGDGIRIVEGRTRLVSVAGGLAAKFARCEAGRLANLDEARLWERYGTDPARGQYLCPVHWSSADGALLVMAAADPLPSGMKPWLDAFTDWARLSDESDCPFEYAAENWGMLDGQPVAIDYGLLPEIECVKIAALQISAKSDAQISGPTPT